jgi:serum/glucocorticoid-regulated kinase 2
LDYVFQNDHRIYFFLEFVRGGNIFDHLCHKRRFSEPAVKFISAQILVALGYLHANKIVHRDLKPANILINRFCQVKFCDFGLARSLPESLANKTQEKETLKEGVKK